MRTLITLLFLTVITLGASCQDTVCFICYTQEQWDSAKAVSDSVIAARDQQIIDIIEVYQNPELFGDSQVTLYDSVGQKATLKKTGTDLWYNVEEGTKRYSFWMVDDGLEIWFGDSTRAELFLRYMLNRE